MYVLQPTKKNRSISEGITVGLSFDEIQKVVSTVDIPACPAIVSETMIEAQKDEPDIDRLAQLIRNDAGMSAMALKLANSASFSRGAAVTGVDKAIHRLGTKNIVCVVVASALRASMTGIPAEWLDKFWKKTIETAVIASAIAKRHYVLSSDAAFTYALFHDAAIPLMAKRFDDYMGVIGKCAENGTTIAEAEASYYPCTHPIVGSLLVRNWGLPKILGLAIRYHHDPSVYELDDRTLPGGAISFIAVTHIAEYLCNETRDEVDIEVGEHLFKGALSHFGIEEDELDELRNLVSEMMEK